MKLSLGYHPLRHPSLTQWYVNLKDSLVRDVSALSSGIMHSMSEYKTNIILSLCIYSGKNLSSHNQRVWCLMILSDSFGQVQKAVHQSLYVGKLATF